MDLLFSFLERTKIKGSLASYDKKNYIIIYYVYIPVDCAIGCWENDVP